jgi:murein DD-endopeptidase MepM/ murein hydrolase activator NlpD
MIRDPQAPEKMFSEEKDGENGVSRENDHEYATLSVRIDRALQQSQLREQGVLQLWDSLSERQSLLSSTPSIKPVHGWYTSRFGYRSDPYTNRPHMHAGLDMAAPPGTPVYAPADGVVSYVGYENGYGKLVSIDHGYGVVTRFGHNSRVFVEQGQKVHRWDVISAVGNTGRSTGPHLHYEVRIHGIAVDPINYILME